MSDHCNVLIGFSTPVSVREDPAGWLDATRAHVSYSLSVVREDVPKLHQAPVIHLRLFAFTFLCLKSNSSSAQATDTIQAELLKWDNDDLAQLTYHASMGAALMGLLDTVKKSHDQSFHELLKLDLIATAAQILVVLRDANGRERFLSQRDRKAQNLLDLSLKVHDSLDSNTLPHREIADAINELSEKSGLYPECVVLQGVQQSSPAPVAGGSFSDIWRGGIEEQVVAIKVMRIFDRMEADLLRKILSPHALLWRQLRHPNVVRFYGVYRWHIEPSRICLVLPWMENGNVLQYLNKSPDTDRVPLLYDIACGLEYLHSSKPPLVHGDLKGTNILITSSLRACLVDFGLLTLMRDTQLPLISLRPSAYAGGSLQWKAPELLDFGLDDSPDQDRNTPAIDNYAFGCVGFELFTEKPPFYDLPNEYRVASAILEGRRPPRPPSAVAKGLDDDVWNVITRCWSVQPAERPSAHELVEILSSKVHPTSAPDWDEAAISRLVAKMSGNSLGDAAHPTSFRKGALRRIICTVQ